MAGEFGSEEVRADIEPERGGLSAGQITATGPNQWERFVTDRFPIEGVVIKALATNTGTVYVQGAGGKSAGYPLAAGDTISIGIDDLSKVYLFFSTAGDKAAYLAITDAGD